jgi:hypothetical protein
MPRLKKKKENIEPERKSNLHLWIIISLLAIQTMFLFYKNLDFIRDLFKTDPNSFYTETVDKKQNTESKTNMNADVPVNDENIRVSIYNGCGSSGIASFWKEKLRNMKYDVRETGNTDKKYAKTVILSRTEDMKYARQLAKSLGVKDENVIMQLNKDLVDIDITLIVGSDHKEFEKR